MEVSKFRTKERVYERASGEVRRFSSSDIRTFRGPMTSVIPARNRIYAIAPQLHQRLSLPA